MMNRLEEDLREGLARQVAAAPPVAGLADRAVRRGRRIRRARTAAAASAAVALVVAAVPVLGLALTDRGGDGNRVAAGWVSGPPRAPLFVGQGPATVVDWPDGTRRSRVLDDTEAVPLVTVPSGLLLVGTGPDGGRLLLLGPDDDQPRPLLDGVDSSVAVTSDGRRAAVVAGTGPDRELREVDLPSGRVLRSARVDDLLGTEGEELFPEAYSGDTVLLTVGEGDDRRAVAWGPGRGAGLVTVDGALAAVGGAGGRGAFEVSDGRCRTEVRDLRAGGEPWRLCREPYVGLSPGGGLVLATNAVGSGLIVRDARDGGLRREFDVPGYVRAAAWESEDTLLYTTVDEERTVIVRCDVSSGGCRDAAVFEDVGRIPQAVPPA